MPVNNIDYKSISIPGSENSDNIRVERTKIPVGNLDDDITLNSTGKTVYVVSNGGISGQKLNGKTKWTKYGGGRKSRRPRKSRRSRKTKRSRKSRRSRK